MTIITRKKNPNQKHAGSSTSISWEVMQILRLTSIQNISITPDTIYKIVKCYYKLKIEIMGEKLKLHGCWHCAVL